MQNWDDFTPPDERGGVYLQPDSLKKLLRLWEERLQQETRHPYTDYKVSHRRCFELQVWEYVQCLIGERETYRRKRPGRAAGHPGSWRKPPPQESIDESIEVPLEQCPACGCGRVGCDQQVIEQSVIELPPITPEVIRLRTYRQVYPDCQHAIASHHPLQVSEATGAAGTHLGPCALGLAASLHHESGLSMCACCRTLEHLSGLSLSPGGLSQALHRIAGRMEEQYDTLLERLQGSAALHMDETGGLGRR